MWLLHLYIQNAYAVCRNNTQVFTACLHCCLSHSNVHNIMCVHTPGVFDWLCVVVDSERRIMSGIITGGVQICLQLGTITIVPWTTRESWAPYICSDAVCGFFIITSAHCHTYITKSWRKNTRCILWLVIFATHHCILLTRNSQPTFCISEGSVNGW